MKTTPSHINKLIEQCKEQNKIAQFTLYDRYHKAIYNTCYRILRNSGEAEDIMQDTFIMAFSKLNDYKGTATIGAWLKRIAINKSINEVKKKKLLLLENTNEIAEQIETEAVNLKNVNVTYILSCINQLKDNYRIVITLQLIEGYDYEEIGDILNYTPENVRKIASRAKQKLKENINLNHIYEH